MMKTITFFNNKGGVGKTSLVYHLAWMYAELGIDVLAADLDPQANLSSMFLSDDRLESLWGQSSDASTILHAIDPILRGTGDIAPPRVEEVDDHIGLLVGNLGVSRFEAKLASAWPNCLDRDESAFRVVSAFYRVIRQAARERSADVVLIDVGPNLGAINRSAIIAANFVAVPLAADLFSLQGLRTLGPTLREWRAEWDDRLQRRPEMPNLDLPPADMTPIGYIVLQHAVRLDRPVKAYEKWMTRIPDAYREDVLGEPCDSAPPVAQDPHCLATLKNYRSLMPLAQEALKPMFLLRAADGALGGHVHAVQSCYDDFERLARNVAERIDVRLPASLLAR